SSSTRSVNLSRNEICDPFLSRGWLYPSVVEFNPFMVPGFWPCIREIQVTMRNVQTHRRGFFGLLTDLVLGAIGLLVLIPAVRFLLSPLFAKDGGGAGVAFLDAGLLAEIKPGEWRLVTVEKTHQDGWKTSKVRHAVWVRRQGEGEKDITVLSSICPHLGCPINWHPD